MLNAEARFKGVRNGLSHFAEVALRLEFPSPMAGIVAQMLEFVDESEV